MTHEPRPALEAQLAELLEERKRSMRALYEDLTGNHAPQHAEEIGAHDPRDDEEESER